MAIPAIRSVPGTRRGIEPGQGSWAQPGGFLEVDETLAEGAIRETWEETGLIVEPGELIGGEARERQHPGGHRHGRRTEDVPDPR